MSASDTALRVIRWATAGEGPPPRGDLRAAEQLSRPPEPLAAALGELARVSLARLRWDPSPPAASRSIGVGGIVIAAAIGVAQPPEVVRFTLDAVPRSRAPAEWAVRHGLVDPALRYLVDAVADDCRKLSPLTAVLDRPVTGAEAQAIATARQLLADPRRRLSLQLHLARPTLTTQVRDWRTRLLETLRVGSDADRTFVVNVYEAAMIHHRAEAVHQIRAALAVMGPRLVRPDLASRRDAISIANWWGPLWALYRSHLDDLRARRDLHYDYLDGLALFQQCQRLTGGPHG